MESSVDQLEDTLINKTLSVNPEAAKQLKDTLPEDHYYRLEILQCG